MEEGKKNYYIITQSEDEFKIIEESYNSFQERILLEKTGEYLSLMKSANDENGIIIFPYFQNEEIINIKKKSGLESLIFNLNDGNSVVEIGKDNFYVMKKGLIREPKHPQNL